MHRCNKFRSQSVVFISDKGIPDLISLRFSHRTLYILGAFFLLFMHWGVNEFLSVQFVFFILAVVKLSPYFASRRIFIFCLVAASLYILLSLIGGHDFHMLLKGVRTTLVMSLLFAARYASGVCTQQQAESRGAVLISAFTVACVLSVSVAAAQLFDTLGPNTGLFDIPLNFFSLEYGTLFAGSRAELSQTYFIRPSAFYSEPSSLALLGNTSLLVGLFGMNKRLSLLGVLTVLISYSLSGLLICLFLAGYFFIFLDRKSHMQTTRAQFIMIASLVIFVGMALLSERILRVSTLEDASTAARIFEPLRILQDMFDRGEYFGAAPETLLARAYVGIFDSWVLNQLLYYGFLGAVPFMLMSYCFGKKLAVVALVFGFINGDLFYYDRLIFLMLFIVAVSSFKRASCRT